MVSDYLNMTFRDCSIHSQTHARKWSMLSTAGISGSPTLILTPQPSHMMGEER